MEKLANASHFLDLGGLDSLRASAQKDEKAALKEVAKQFEGIFVQMLLKSMRDANAVFESDNPMNSQYTKFYEQMRDQQLSVDLSNKGMLGLADLMVQQLSPKDSPITPASMAAAKGRTDVVGENRAAERPLHSDAHDLNAPVRQAHHANPMVSVPFTAQQPLPEASVLMGQAPRLDSPFERVLTGKVTATEQLQVEREIARENVQFGERSEFVSVLYPHAQKAAKALGTTPEVLLAQSALETGWGQKMARRGDGTGSNNLFNIKADSRWQGERTSVNTLEFEQGVAVRQKSDFRVYDTLEQSFSDFVAFIQGGDRYQGARQQAARPQEFIQGLQNAGYATDPQYADKVMRVMQSVTAELKALAIGGRNE
ncbi:flagellar assembly peptidoglycan hydrolase FlgJ [Shewanella sedimentimangrovi]|uniref:Peptidoglycan hydrolase FlgJ n=1 Tax=Shewanella sedimentimangrovi TaxID=2814293 RepID=A0ABX7QZ52_9GAMM|nr:flagellar assembly peptidoglycan hydrolase FlgJ [Shewanella sedimentimangrovi]QSX36088.1 flagellar assembly peptidoglycan hydrolase FlgJ [Shewanella sedimentimangrovi]